MLWPEKTDKKARHLLAVAVYEIRKRLGEDVLESRGDDLVLNPSKVRTDLDSFDAAVDRNDLEAAVEAYTGPFLDGFHLRGSVAFDHWVDQTRHAIVRRYRGALESLAEQREAAGDLPGAVKAWRRLAAVDRFDSRVALRLLEALIAAGNRAGALQYARAHTSLLEEEFGAEPTEEFTAATQTLLHRRDVVVPDLDSAAAGGDRSTSEPPGGREPPGGAEETPAAPGPGTSGTRAGSGLAAVPGPWPTTHRGMVRAVLMIALIGSAIGLATWLSADPTDTVSIAVLPFEGSGPIGVDERSSLTYGLTVETLEALSQVDGVRVPVQSAVFALEGEDALYAARILDADYVIGGRFNASTDSLRVDVDIADSRGFKEWSYHYERSRGDVFQTSEEIAAAVLDAVRFRLGDTDRIPDVKEPDPVAAELYWKGRAAWLERTPAAFVRALGYYQQAVAQDPTYAEAHAAIADVHNLMGAYDYGMLPPDTAYPMAREAALRALQIDPGLSDAHAALAMTAFAYERAWEGAGASFTAALRLDDRNAQARHWYALYLTARGRLDEAMRQVESALVLDSLSPIMHTSRARQYYFRRRYDLARAGYERALRIDGSFFTALHGLGLVLVQQGQPDEGLLAYRRAIDLLGGSAPPITLALIGNAHGRAGRVDSARAVLARLNTLRASGVYVPPEYDAVVHVALGELDLALQGLRQAYHDGSGAVAFFRVEPLLEPLRGYPPFESLCDSAGVRDPGLGRNRN